MSTREALRAVSSRPARRSADEQGHNTPRADCAELEGRVARLERWRATIEARHGARDAAEAALPRVLASAVGSRRFTARELFRHARVDPDVRRALVAADLVSPKAVGRMLARLDGQVLHGCAVRRVPGRRRATTSWFVSIETAPDHSGTLIT